MTPGLPANVTNAINASTAAMVINFMMLNCLALACICHSFFYDIGYRFLRFLFRLTGYDIQLSVLRALLLVDACDN